MSAASFQSVLYASGPADWRAPAFFHALRLALSWRAELTLLLAQEGPETDDEATPRSPVRETLERWTSGPERDSIPVDEAAEGVEGARVLVTGGSPLEAAVRYLERHPADLLVVPPALSLSGARWSRTSLMGSKGRRAATRTLFVGERGFVDPETGALRLRHLLVPIASVPEPEIAVEAVESLLHGLGQEPETASLLWVGERSRMPRVDPRTEGGWGWRRIARPGRVAEEILRAASAVGADLIALATPETQGPLALLTRSDTRRVLREARCPVLAVPGAERAAARPTAGVW
ncbi:MAG: universal stress protein [Myxococcota bacterium]